MFMKKQLDLGNTVKHKKDARLPGGESNPGLPRDRRGYSPLYYRGCRYVCSVNTISLIGGFMDTCLVLSVAKTYLTKEGALCRN